jgi:membrane protein implicated in regulation of membrane protease activity
MQRLYRVVAAAVALYLLVFGILGLAETWGQPAFDRGDDWVLGLQTNPAFSVMSIIAGVVVLGASVIGRNVDHFVNLWGGIAFLVAGIVMLTLLRTEANLLNFAVINCVVSFLIGLVLLTAGLYGKVGPPDLQEAEERLRHGQAGQPEHAEQPERAAGTAPDESPSDVEARTDVPVGGDRAQDGSDRRS